MQATHNLKISLQCVPLVALTVPITIIALLHAVILLIGGTESATDRVSDMGPGKGSAHPVSSYRASYILEPRERSRSEVALNRTAEVNSVSSLPTEIKEGVKKFNFDDNEDHVSLCPSLVECHKLGGDCINCAFNKSCIYGANVTVRCTPKKNVQCTGSSSFERRMICQYCYQSDNWLHSCSKSSSCRVASNPRERFLSNCTMNSDVICLGNRTFQKYFLCNWTSGYKWSTAMILSITLGGFGVDRFYLGHWQEGIGKLFSFGGLGVWTLLDVLLIAIGYLRPADGSLYI